jgi:hypothetical protein
VMPIERREANLGWPVSVSVDQETWNYLNYLCNHRRPPSPSLPRRPLAQVTRQVLIDAMNRDAEYQAARKRGEVPIARYLP